ncbi:MAG: response regulator [Streptosporangiales bacterium]|nr:response regulator [Streptosporangiales bacterium]
MIGVLVVDDDFMVARIHSRFVEATDGFTVVGTAHTGEAAVRGARELRPDLVLLDVYLPDMSGLDVVGVLRDDVPDVDVLVVTAAREADAVRRALRGGVVDYLLKPFEYDDLRERLVRYRATARALDETPAPDQEAVDRVFGTHAPVRNAMPKGMSHETARLVEHALRGAAGTMSAAECATAVGLSRVSARRYLEHFVVSGRADVRLRYGTTGRPERRYAWTSP